MSAIQAQHTHRDEDAAPRRPREDLDRDLVAVVAMLAILALTALCFLGRTALPL
ncbi:MAG: hypothetical protein JWN84_1735 [Nocardioides sp.]|nr:hypothetical protein [Nocardioides sp.]